MVDLLENFFNEFSWNVTSKQKLPSKEKQLVPYIDMNLTGETKKYLKAFAPYGIYLHQKMAVESFLLGENSCLCTGTASGKSLAFYIAGIETLVRDPNSKIIAIYPIKALGVEQQERWNNALRDAGLDIKVGRIDGHVSVSKRKQIIKECRVVIFTPDVIHAWLLSNLSEKFLLNFLQSVKLLVVDEVHAYTGVFGSNSSFLFRRIRHIMNLCNNEPRYIAASATIANPSDHLTNLFGVNFSNIDTEYDTSPKYGMDMIMLDPVNKSDFLSEVTQFILRVASNKEKFITFVDSRKQTELLVSILSRGQNNQEDEYDDVEEEISTTLDSHHLQSLNILPYRAGYEERDRDLIQSRLSKGGLGGVVSTSALELGLDIPDLDVAILIGVPNSATSLFQRIGRVGRHKRGKVFVINSGSFYDEIVFKNPDSLLHRPLVESTLYLENTRIQYIHALCLARYGGEHDQTLSTINQSDEEGDFTTKLEWPKGFIQLCESERIGDIPAELQSMKSESGDEPNYIYPLRDVEKQFKVELKQGPEQRDLGSLSYSQVLREAYPGAVYYYTANAYRVYKVNTHGKLIYVRKEKRYTTTPNRIPTLVYPNLSEGNVYDARKYKELLVFESHLQITESITGFKERRGSVELPKFQYPLKNTQLKKSGQLNVYYDQSRFNRNYFTSGVVFTHPIFNEKHIGKEIMDRIASLIYEAFLISIPFERQDLDYAMDSHRTTKEGYFEKGDRFIAIYDKTYGSLRLSGHVMKEDLMSKVFMQALEIAQIDNSFEMNEESLALLKALVNESTTKGTTVSFESNGITISNDSIERVIMPDSVGLAVHDSRNEEYSISSVFFNPREGKLCYRGRLASQNKGDTSVTILPISSVVEIPGVSVMGIYNYESGEIEPL